MKNNVYTLYNTLSSRYGEVTSFPSDAFAVQRIREAMKPEMLAEIELCNVGFIDVDTGIVEAHAPVRISLTSPESPVPIDNLEK
ncbi:hypothetical protein [Tortoise microvirus 95]|nr:hypothetical protein [Tortoise microvirus 3]QCS37378.1 hypothetical protein [Tortoise microvirus 95]QCS37396.1 hypothetical protein [Tortoise microvirus 98]QCS37440.1 hypothetical protein [Tortoise microvirus 3]QCS37493.1 hypothetical protein [Tortoise microvirus 109]